MSKNCYSVTVNQLSVTILRPLVAHISFVALLFSVMLLLVIIYQISGGDVPLVRKGDR